VPPRRCPCGTGLTYAECCGRLHDGTASAATAEQLMRSRYSAFALGDDAYLSRSWHTSTRPPHLRTDRSQRWTRLEILGASGGGLLDAEGSVEFRAHYSASGRPGVLHEDSCFVREGGRWVYLTGTTREG
jgi:SEC-C motif domain protein